MTAKVTNTAATPSTGPDNRVLKLMANPAKPLSPANNRPSSAFSPPSQSSKAWITIQMPGVNTIDHHKRIAGQSERQVQNVNRARHDPVHDQGRNAKRQDRHDELPSPSPTNSNEASTGVTVNETASDAMSETT